MMHVFAQLLADGYCIVDFNEQLSMLNDAFDLISSWFTTASPQQKADAASAAADAAAGTGRGYFNLPSKEVLEVTNIWDCRGARTDLRLAAKAAYTTLQQIAHSSLSDILSTSNGLKQQLQELLGHHHQQQQQQQGNGNSKPQCSSVLHINNYRLADAAAAAGHQSGFSLQGCEAHVDKGLLTVIYSTGPGLQVFSREGSWLPVTAGPGQLVILVGHTLSYMTAGRLPAALHRVVTQQQHPPAAAAGSSSSSSGRLSLCFKLRAAPGALLSPAKVTGADANSLPERFRCPTTAQQLMAVFDATHQSINGQSDATQHQRQQHQGQQPAQASAHPAVVLARPAAGGEAAVIKRHSPLGNSRDQQQHKRQCLQPLQSNILAATTAEGDKQHMEGQKISLTIVNQNGNRVCVKASPREALLAVADAYARHQECTGHRLLFDGRLLQLGYTLEGLGF